MKGSPWYYPFLALALSILSGVMLAFALPPRSMSPLGWAAFAPLLVASRMTGRALIAAFYGMWTAITCAWVLAGRWETASQYGNLLAAFGGLALVFAFIAGLSCFAAKRLSPAWWALLVACAGVTGELLSRFIFPVTVAISQYQNATALRIAGYTGIWGVSFALWLAPAAAVAMVIRPKKAWPVFALCAAGLAAAVYAPAPEEPPGAMLAVAAIQSPNPESARQQTSRVASQARVVVWPELLMNSASRVAHLAAVRNNVCVVASFTEPSGTGKPYNAAYLISPRGDKLAVFRKQHLFGKEYMSFARGDDSRPARWGGFAAGVPICFDTEFTDITRRLVRRGADVILVPNADPDMPNYLFNYLHAAVIPFRAAENAVPVVWSECGGLSMVVDRTGRIVAQVPSGAVGAAVETVRLRGRQTFFTYAGDYFAYLCAAGLLAIIAVQAKQARWRRSGMEAKQFRLE